MIQFRSGEDQTGGIKQGLSDMFERIQGRQPRMSCAMAPAILLGTFIIFATVIKTVTTLPIDGSVAVVFPPWSSKLANWSVVAAADGLVTRELLGGSILVAIPARPGLADRLAEAETLALINPLAIGGCSGV